MMRWIAIVGALLVTLAANPRELTAQDEANLRQALEGTRVTLKIDMPATTEGVDVYPGTSRPVDFQEYGGRLKEHGTAIASGESALITKIRVKGKHIEVQLDGGGYGTFGDAVDSWSSSTGADSGAAQQAKIANERTERLGGGSRFNVRYPSGVTPAEMHANVVAAALSKYADFPNELSQQGGGSASADSRAALGVADSEGDAAPKKGMSLDAVNAIAGVPTSSTTVDQVTTNRYSLPDGNAVEVDFFRGVAVDVREIAASAAGSLRKGLSVAEVEQMAGKPVSSSQDGAVITSSYRWQGGTLTAEYYNEVLVSYTIASE